MTGIGPYVFLGPCDHCPTEMKAAIFLSEKASCIVTPGQDRKMRACEVSALAGGRKGIPHSYAKVERSGRSGRITYVQHQVGSRGRGEC